jgi:predicted lipoprotein with Yx(FWY)xxD motif
MRRIATFLLLPVFVGVLLAGCGSDSKPTAATKDDSSATSSSASPPSLATVQLAKTSLGQVLVDADGRTLYLFMKDADGKSACTGPCADTWPALKAGGKPTAGTGVEAEDLGTITRDDGTTQVTYYGKPLYLYKGDSKAGDVNGQNIGGVWFAVTAKGEPAKSATATSSKGSGY